MFGREGSLSEELAEWLTSSTRRLGASAPGGLVLKEKLVWTEANQTQPHRSFSLNTWPESDKVLSARPCLSALDCVPSIAQHRAWHVGGLRVGETWGSCQVGVYGGEEGPGARPWHGISRDRSH